jgi:hypothetical protein
MIERDPTDPRFAPIMLRGELIDAGWNDRAIARMCSEGAWVRVRRGAYVEMHYWRLLDPAGRHELLTRSVLRQANTDLVVSHVSGVPFYDGPIWGLDLSSVHGTRLDGKAGRAEAGVRQHRGQVVEGDVVERHGVMVMGADRLGLEVTTVASTEAALVVVNHLLHAEETTRERLAERYARDIYGWSHTLRTDLVLRLADPRIESPGESRTFYLCFARGLPLPEPQYEIYDDRGVLVAQVDFAWPELGVFLEFDGKVKYQKYLKEGESPSDVVVREKRREELVCELTGWRCIRVVWADLDRPEHTAQRIRRALSAPTRIAS